MLITELRWLLPVWTLCTLLPLPAIVLWRSSDGRSAALACFFIGCASLMAYAFSRKSHCPVGDTGSGNGPVEALWRTKMLASSLALFGALIIFSTLSLLF